jgi:predicted secreted protein
MDDFVGRVASSGISPAEAFTTFCKESTDVLRQEISSLISDHDMADEDVRDKLKKTFKNRYFQKIRKVAPLKKIV